MNCVLLKLGEILNAGVLRLEPRTGVERSATCAGGAFVDRARSFAMRIFPFPVRPLARLHRMAMHDNTSI